MEYVIIIFGIVIGFIGFLYIISLLDFGKRKIEKINIGKIETKSTRIKAEVKREPVPGIKNLSDDLKEKIPERSCPLCGKALRRDEPLYASFIDVKNERKVLIYGCSYCYKGAK